MYESLDVWKFEGRELIIQVGGLGTKIEGMGGNVNRLGTKFEGMGKMLLKVKQDYGEEMLLKVKQDYGETVGLITQKRGSVGLITQKKEGEGEEKKRDGQWRIYQCNKRFAFESPMRSCFNQNKNKQIINYKIPPAMPRKGSQEDDNLMIKFMPLFDNSASRSGSVSFKSPMRSCYNQNHLIEQKTQTTKWQGMQEGRL